MQRQHSHRKWQHLDHVCMAACFATTYNIIPQQETQELVMKREMIVSLLWCCHSSCIHLIVTPKYDKHSMPGHRFCIWKYSQICPNRPFTAICIMQPVCFWPFAAYSLLHLKQSVLKGHLSYMATNFWSPGWPLKTDLTVMVGVLGVATWQYLQWVSWGWAVVGRAGALAC
jgi:hypothetical protein